MLAVIEKVEGGYIARFERHLHHSVEKVWAALTENEKLEKWMPNLQVENLQKEGKIKFNMKDGTGASFDLKITDYEKGSVLEYEWGNGKVRFELSPEPNGCLLVLKEFISELNDHTPKDLSGWHICLKVLNVLLNGSEIEFPMDEWEEVYEQYKETLL